MLLTGLVQPHPKTPSCLNVLGNTTTIDRMPEAIKAALLKACSIMGHQLAAEAALGLSHQPGLIPEQAAGILASWVAASSASASACRMDVSVLQALAELPHTARKVTMRSWHGLCLCPCHVRMGGVEQQAAQCAWRSRSCACVHRRPA
jgi:hypothetical protein